MLLRNGAGLNVKRLLLATATLVSLGFMSTIAQAPSALSGVIDIHAHTDPDSRPRSIDALDLAKMAKARGMRGLVLKNHFEPTAAQAYLVRKASRPRGFRRHRSEPDGWGNQSCRRRTYGPDEKWSRPGYLDAHI